MFRQEFATDEQLTLESVTPQPGARRSWTTRLADWVPLDRIPDDDAVAGRLVVNVALLTGRDDGATPSVLTLYDTQVHLTRHALDTAS